MRKALPSSLLLCWGVFFSSGCGPSLDKVVRETHWYRADRPCAQGPFELRFAASGARWGEGIEADVGAARAMHGHFELEVAGTVRSHGSWRTSVEVNSTTTDGRATSTRRQDVAADNGRCVEQPDEIAPSSQEAEPQLPLPVTEGPAQAGVEPLIQPLPPTYPPPPMSQPPPGYRPPPNYSPPSGYRPPPRYPPPPGYQPPRRHRLPDEGQPTGTQPVTAPDSTTAVGTSTPPAAQTNGPAALIEFAGAQARGRASGSHHTPFLVWLHSDPRLEGAMTLPVGATIVLRIWSDEPQDWSQARLRVALLDVRPDVPEAEWIAHLRAKKAERRREAAERAAQARADAEKRARRRRHCDSHHDDEDCWGDGGYAGWQGRRRATEARWRKERAAAKERALRRRTAARPDPEVSAQPVPGLASGPPPQAQPEEIPPPPSDNAVWIEGYWRRSTSAWVWLGGWWKVPAADVSDGRTVVAPAPPPGAQVEVLGRRPCEGAVWLPGGWVWDGHLWFWIGGRWTVPPRLGLRWRSSRWSRFGAGVRLVPGTWELAFDEPSGQSLPPAPSP